MDGLDRSDTFYRDTCCRKPVWDVSSSYDYVQHKSSWQWRCVLGRGRLAFVAGIDGRDLSFDAPRRACARGLSFRAGLGLGRGGHGGGTGEGSGK